MRQRWLLYAAIVASVLGILCIVLVTTVFSIKTYADREAELHEYVETAST